MIFTEPSSSRAVREQRHLAGVLDRGGHVALVLGAVPRDTPRTDLSPLGHELLQQSDVLEIDVVDPLLAEDADLLLLLLLPALVVFLFANPLLGLSRHPAVSPLPHLRRPRRRAPNPTRRRPSDPASPPWRS